MKNSVPEWFRLFSQLVNGWPIERRHNVLKFLAETVAKEHDVHSENEDYHLLWESNLHELGHLLTFKDPRDWKNFQEELRPAKSPTIGAYISHMSRREQALNEADALAFEIELIELFGLKLPLGILNDGYNNADAGSTLNVTWGQWVELVKKRRNSRLVRRALQNAFPRFAAAYERLRKEHESSHREPVAPPVDGPQSSAG